LKAKVKLEAKPVGLSFQDLILKLMHFWGRQGSVLQQPYDTEVGAGTMHPETFLRVLGPAPYRVAYVQPSRRPADGRYGENPNRLYKHFQYQVLLKPAPADIQDMYLKSLEAIGIRLSEHDVRFEEDNWESPTLGAWGIGWQVLLDGLEITQFTYFQQSGGLDLDPISVEITYGLERICAFLQNVESVYEIQWSAGKTYGDIRLAEEQQLSEYSFDRSDAKALRSEFELHEKEAKELLEGWKQQRVENVGAPTLRGVERARYPVLAAYDHCLKCSHLFNLMDARGVISTTERAALMARVRTLACRAAAAYLEQTNEATPAPAKRDVRGHEVRA
jgi:glycyl-tRNA synthetase alpha chain